jgi:hypothetical protein
MLQRGTQATTLQLTPATEGRNQRGRGPTVETPSFEKLVTHSVCLQIAKGRLCRSQLRCKQVVVDKMRN